MLRPRLWKASAPFLLAGALGCLPPAEESINKSPAVNEEESTPEAETDAKPDGEAAAGAAATGDAKDFKTTESGLKYKIIKPGSGEKPDESDTVLAHYKGWLDNGKVFDSSYDRGEPTEFPLGGVIAGWTEGLQLIGEGGEIELIIPSELGYGAAGAPPDIPPGATLHFRVELKDVR
jgi:FKBP-type peptidyl-prolyl cis-trans isomerase